MTYCEVYGGSGKLLDYSGPVDAVIKKLGKLDYTKETLISETDKISLYSNRFIVNEAYPAITKHDVLMMKSVDLPKQKFIFYDFVWTGNNRCGPTGHTPKTKKGNPKREYRQFKYIDFSLLHEDGSVALRFKMG